jgi:hypothetical protein
MPQGAAASPDGSTLAVVESGYNPPALAFYATHDLHLIRRVPLKGAFGRPAWSSDGVLVAGANADAVFAVNPTTGTVAKFPLPAHSYPVSVASRGRMVAVATDGDGSVRIGKLDELNAARAIHVGSRPAGIVFTGDGSAAFVAIRSASFVTRVDVRSGDVQRFTTDLHPSAVLVDGDKLYVAQADADTLGTYDVKTGERLADLFVGATPGYVGSSPNALQAQGGSIFISLGAANQIAVVSDGRVVERLPAGWYPTDAVPVGSRLFVVDGKGEGTKPNPQFDYKTNSDVGYIAAMQYGSIREIGLLSALPAVNPQGASGYDAPAPNTIVRKGGPIQHVFFILKENRTYDQVLGDLPEGNGDSKIAWFGERVTPNQHAIVRRFGIFDNFYTSGEVSDPGHNWSDGAIANDYVERDWPPTYGGRRPVDDIVTGWGAAVPRNGYIWDAARRAGVTFRDYGEMATLEFPTQGAAPSLGGRFDPRYTSWNLDYSDLDREKEWRREFDQLVAAGTVPQLEWIWLPNDHTYGSRAGKLTPSAYVAQNDAAVGLVIAAISHSKIWASSAIFITEDDAQDGADHVSDQRSTLYIASPYARGGVVHDHYSTLSILRTIELMLGLEPLTTYDATAVPLYAAFGSTPNLAPFDAMPPKIDIDARNAKVAYGQRQSELADFSRPDAVPADLMIDILAHNHQ